MEKIRKYWNRPSRSAYVFIDPSIILLILFNIIPLIMAFGLSFFDVPITMNHATFVGWDNFVEAFHDPRFINSLKVTAIFTGIEVPVQVLGALVIAAFISKNNKRNKFLRAVYFLPVICSATVITSLIGIANPIPSTLSSETFMYVIPTSSPFILTSAPPLLHGLIAASVWITFISQSSTLSSF